MTPEHRRYDVVELPWDLARSALAEQLSLTEAVFDKVVSLHGHLACSAILILSQNATLNEEELEDYFIIERDSGEPDSEGRLTYTPKLREISPELDEQMKVYLKALKKAKPDAFADKRKRGTAIAQALVVKLAQYPTTAGEDEALLKKGGLGKRHRMAIEVRLGEKMLLKEAIELMQGPTSADNEGNGERAVKKAKTQA